MAKCRLLVMLFIFLILNMFVSGQKITETTVDYVNEERHEMTIGTQKYVKTTDKDVSYVKIEDALSIKDKGFKYVIKNNDSDYYLEILDYNYTSVKIVMGINEKSHINKEIPLKIQARQGNFTHVETIDVYVDKFIFKDTNQRIYYTITLDNDTVINKDIKFGLDSTTATLQGTSDIEDTTIVSSAVESNFGARTDLSLGRTGGGSIRRILIKPVDVNSTIPEDADILDGQLCLYRYNGYTTSSFEYGAYRLAKDWVEGDEDGVDNDDGDATWVDWQSDDLEWATSGANNANYPVTENSGDGTGDDRSSQALDLINVGGNGWYCWNITEAVNGWYNGSWSHYGVILHYTGVFGYTDKNFYSTEYGITADTPYLNVTYDTCEPDWYCSGYGECNISDLRPCNETTDNNSCGNDYAGDYSEFSPQSCNYCIEDVQSVESDCINQYITEYYVDNNLSTCCNVTALVSDCSILYSPYNSSQNVDCSYLNCSWFTYTEYGQVLKNNPKVVCETNIRNGSCLSYILDNESGIVQVNPTLDKKTRTLNPLGSVYEDRASYPVINGLVTVYFTTDNLVFDTRNYTYMVKCSNNDSIKSDNISIIPNYKNINKPAPLILWLKNNMQGAIILTIGAIIAIILLGYLLYLMSG